jgi:hypothetical protein
LSISNAIRQNEGSLKIVDTILKYVIEMVEIRSYKPPIEFSLTGFKQNAEVPTTIWAELSGSLAVSHLGGRIN